MLEYVKMLSELEEIKTQKALNAKMAEAVNEIDIVAMVNSNEFQQLLAAAMASKMMGKLN